MVGLGRVGSAVIQNILEQIPLFRERFGLSLKIRGVMNSTRMLLDEDLNDVLKSKIKIFSPTAPHDDAALRRVPSGRMSPCASTTDAAMKRSSSREDRKPGYKYYKNESFEDLCAALSLGDTSLPSDMTTFLAYVTGSPTPHNILIDCTNSLAVAQMHPIWLKGGAHVVTAK